MLEGLVLFYGNPHNHSDWFVFFKTELFSSLLPHLAVNKLGHNPGNIALQALKWPCSALLVCGTVDEGQQDQRTTNSLAMTRAVKSLIWRREGLVLGRWWETATTTVGAQRKTRADPSRFRPRCPLDSGGNLTWQVSRRQWWRWQGGPLKRSLIHFRGNP